VYGIGNIGEDATRGVRGIVPLLEGQGGKKFFKGESLINSLRRQRGSTRKDF
jgi:hypothetical protein